MRISYDTKHLKQVVVNRAILLGKEFKKIDKNIEYGCLVLEIEDKKAILNDIPFAFIDSLEEIVKQDIDYQKELNRIVKEYDFINFSKAVASERSFTDYSFLFNSTGYRKEDKDYIYKLIVNMTLTIEKHFKEFKPDVLVTGAPDGIFTYLVIVLAEFYGIKLALIRPGWLNDFGTFECGYIGNDLYTVSNEMKFNYIELKNRSLNKEELKKVEDFKEYVKNFQYNKMMKNWFKRDVTKQVISHNLKNIFEYKKSVDSLDKDINFNKPDLLEKAKANIIRFIRRKQFNRYIKSFDNKLSEKSIYFPLQFQPEESTLVKGIDYSNQIALIEHLSKSIPLGYTLVVKEHPLGRGNRPLWQYKHIESFYNVKMVELPSLEIIKKCDLIISISGTVGMESLIYEKPIIMLANTYYTFDSKLFNIIDNPKELDKLIYKILISKEIKLNIDDINKFFLSYLNGLKQEYPFNSLEGLQKYAKYIIENVEKF